jgi:hypothetical protein
MPLNTPITIIIIIIIIITAPQITTRRQALQPNHINPGIARAYKEGLGYNLTTLCIIISNLLGGIYTALRGQAIPLKGLERYI